MRTTSGYYRTTPMTSLFVPGAVTSGIRYRGPEIVLTAENEAHRKRQELHRTPVLLHSGRTFEIPGGRLHGAARARARQAAAAATPSTPTRRRLFRRLAA